MEQEHEAPAHWQQDCRTVNIARWSELLDSMLEKATAETELKPGADSHQH